MSDLLSEMASDSGEGPDKLDTLDSSKLDGVSRLATQAASLEREISDVEQLLKGKKQALHKITDEQLPEALEEMGLQNLRQTHIRGIHSGGPQGRSLSVVERP
jgi:hypothetical protein